MGDGIYQDMTGVIFKKLITRSWLENRYIALRKKCMHSYRLQVGAIVTSIYE